MSDTDREMLNELIVESREHLENIEPDLLELEQNGNSVSDELVNRVFRAVHSIKGGFGFFAIDTIVNLAHAMENVMSKVRDKKIDVTSSLTDALLEGIDKLSLLLDDVDNSSSISIEDEIAKLKPFLSDDILEKTKPNSQPLGSELGIEDMKKIYGELTDNVIEEAIKNGKLIYQISINPKKDIIEKKIKISTLFSEWEKFGEIIQTIPDKKNLKIVKELKAITDEISVLYVTVLESDLISEGLEVDDEAVLNIDISSYRNRVEKNLTKKATKNTRDESNTKVVTKKSESRIEDALRVKVGLLNNLMNNAGELVLARNQLIQFVGRSFTEFQESQKTTKIIMDSISKVLDEVANRSSDKNRFENELAELEKSIMSALNFKLSDIQGINNIVQNVNMVTTVLQEGIMQTRMQPISVVFSKFPRVIRDLAKKLGKSINLTQIGQEVELDKSIIELLSDPLVHLIRNCADHGIESIEDREKMGKDGTGQVVLKAFQEGGKVIIEIDDDGAGIDPDIIKAKALEKGVIKKDKAEKMSKVEAQMLIFAPGFSTAEKLSDVSGRGVGMDVVKTNIERLGGTIEIDSNPGDGTRVTMKLPLTLAIIPSLIVMSENRRFAVPQVGLEEIVRIRAKDISSKIERINSSEVLRLRGKLLPLVRLSTTLGIVPTFTHPELGVLEDKRERLSDRRGTAEEQAKEKLENEKRKSESDRRESLANAVKILVLKIEKNLFGLVVDDVLDSEEIVVKPLPEYLKASQCYAGSTIMGDGRVAMIIDPNGLAQMAELRLDKVEKDLKVEEKKRMKNAPKLEDILLFSIGGKEHLAISLDEIAKIEKRNIDEIEVVGSKEFLKNNDQALQIIHLDHYMPVTATETNSESMFIIIPKGTDQPMGFVASKVEDTVSTELVLNTETIKGLGVKGSQIINENLTLVLDVPALVEVVTD